ncbi:hypothetical protein T4B_8940 [Trichinella pseudospiralis]|uniref:Uncharacterized protein n=1 Tax=Trichinella pseudospiralis TaxID=6337 RepID=A0A0V1EJF0_TRIPS|nr:hypothetical protein T4A_9477 [Trichinella pseudospiralis]KRZ13237.1 hypothetical protein T4B_8940 [Trichinella pseudospiralis]
MGMQYLLSCEMGFSTVGCCEAAVERVAWARTGELICALVIHRLRAILRRWFVALVVSSSIFKLCLFTKEWEIGEQQPTVLLLLSEKFVAELLSFTFLRFVVLICGI